MASITIIQPTDLITDSQADLNNNFAALNSDKIETSFIDTDTTLAANSDSKVATQKAVKAYVDAGGNVNATTERKGIVEIATQTEVINGTDLGSTEANLVVSPSSMNTQINAIIAASRSAGITTHDTATTTTTLIAHGLGVVPSLVSVKSHFASTSTLSTTEAVIVLGTTHSIYAVQEATTGANGEGFRIYSDGSDPDYTTATVTVNDTYISLTWVKTNTPTGNAQLLWVAQK